MNCLCLECEGFRLIVDCGLTFPDLPFGTEIIHPDFDYLRQNPIGEQVVVLTHGHEDHIGALPYLLRMAARPMPIYGPSYALAMVRERLAEFPGEPAPAMHVIRPGERIRLGPLEVEPYRVAHSIPDSTGLIIHTPAGIVVHTGDYRIDRVPPDGEALDEEAMARLGDLGVRLLLSDSTNVEREEISGSEVRVAERLLHYTLRSQGRVVVTMFASNVYRLQALVAAAHASQRRLFLMGRSMRTHARVAQSLGLLPALTAVQIGSDEARRTAPSKLLVGATGSQGELRAALQRLARGIHPTLSLQPGDRVIHSARTIPGKERVVYATFDELARSGVDVIHRGDDPDLHVSGHASRSDQRRMLELLRPQAFVPVHGTRHHLARHAALAHEMGVQQITVIENGARLRVTSETMSVAGAEPVGRVHFQAGRPVDDIVLRDRALMAELGLCLITLVLDEVNQPKCPPRVFTRGILHEDECKVLLEELVRLTRATLAQLPALAEEMEIVRACCQAVRRALHAQLGFRPPVHCIVHRLPCDPT